MVERHQVIGKILSALMLAFYLLYILPRVKPTLVSFFVIAISVGLIADVVARFLAGKNDWKILAVAVLIIVANIIFFAYAPASPV